jgi:hypothetical protein
VLLRYAVLGGYKKGATCGGQRSGSGMGRGILYDGYEIMDYGYHVAFGTFCVGY